MGPGTSSMGRHRIPGAKWARPASIFETVPSWPKLAAVLIAPLLSAQAIDDVVFQLSAKRDPPVFRIGERIELDLRFSTKSVEKYKIQTSAGIRSSPIAETYAISPAEGAVDPKPNELIGCSTLSVPGNCFLQCL